MLFNKSILIFLISLIIISCSSENTRVVIGSKRFTENYIVAEIIAQYLEEQGHDIERRMGMGGTMIAYSALKTHEIDIYPEYTGTVSEAILKIEERDFHKINDALKDQGVMMLPSLGFNNSYALVMHKERAQSLGIESITDLSQFSQLRGGLSFEFQGRKDGWRALQKKYQLKNKIKGIEIPLTYEALKNNKIDFAEAYTTEPLIKKYNFLVLKDDQKVFPSYLAVPFVRLGLSEKILSDLKNLSDLISQDEMMALNERATSGESIAKISQDFLKQKQLVASDQKELSASNFSWGKMLSRTYTHLLLTGLAVFLATLVAIPFAALISSRPKIAGYVLNLTGVLQTIPSIALLTMMIPLFGIGFKPALIGLFIYSLLPILRNTQTALSGIDPRLITSARGIGLYPTEIFFSVKLPLALPSVIGGIRTASTLNVGTATLAAFIGAGGLGEPIVTGLALNNTNLVLQGAIPAAILALLIDGFFALIEKYFMKTI